MKNQLPLRLVTDELWAIVEPLLPEFAVRTQGGGTAGLDPRAVFTAVVFVLVAGVPWHGLLSSFGVTKQTASRRFLAWSRADLWLRLDQQIPELQCNPETIAWLRVIVDTAHTRLASSRSYALSTLDERKNPPNNPPGQT